MSLASLDGRIVLVTGGGAGIGRGIVEACHDAGATVVVGTLEAAPRYPGRERIDARALDVADAAAIARFVDATIARHERIDGLVNNAGLTLQGPFLEMPATDLERLWAVNQRAPFLVSQAVGRHMRDAGRGAIVNVASNHARASDAGYEMYAATRAAIVAMTRAMAWSLGPYGVRVNSLSPGLTLTETIAAGPASDSATDAAFRAWHATGRYNRVGEVGACAAFLLSDAASALSGSDLLADQGMSARLGAST